MGDTVTKKGTADKIRRIFEDLDKDPCVKDAKPVSRDICASYAISSYETYTISRHWSHEIYNGYGYRAAETSLDVINVAREVLRKGMGYLNIDSEQPEIKNTILQLDRLEASTKEAMKSAANEDVLTALTKVTSLCMQLRNNQEELQKSLKTQTEKMNQLESELAKKSDRTYIPDYSLELKRIENKITSLSEAVNEMNATVEDIKPKPKKKHSLFHQ